MRRLFVIVTLLFIVPINSLAMMRFNGFDYSVKDQVKRYNDYSYRHLAPAFKQAGLTYPGKKIALLVFKHERRLELWAANKKSAWHHIKNFPILAASGGPGPKLLSMDHQVPEGIYRISSLNPNSHFHLSMRLNYPNRFDRRHARVDDRRNLGGDIFIHGSNRSIGCIAIGNKNIDQLFVLVYQVGLKNSKVIIAPNDLRHEKPLYSKTHHHPQWLRQLYASIETALLPFQRANA